jgi:hypothetical protein
LEEKGDDDGFYTSLFTIVYAVAALVEPLGGMFSDRLGLGWAQGVSTLFVAASFFVLASRGSLSVQVIIWFLFWKYWKMIRIRALWYIERNRIILVGHCQSVAVSSLGGRGRWSFRQCQCRNRTRMLDTVWLTITERRIPMAQTFWIPTRKCNDDTST